MSTTPGVPVQETITLTNVGNVVENNIALAATLPTGLTATGLGRRIASARPVDERDDHAHPRLLDTSEQHLGRHGHGDLRPLRSAVTQTLLIPCRSPSRAPPPSPARPTPPSSSAIPVWAIDSTT